MYRFQRRCVTLIEMMIVMFLIALITGVIAYNYRGSLDEGKAFKTKAAKEKLETVLNLEVAKNPSSRDEIADKWKSVILQSPIVHDAKALITDGWGEEYHVYVDQETGAIKVESRKYDEYVRSHPTSISQ